MDSLMFDAYNRHDLAGLMDLFSDSLEFYHDTGGLLSRQQVSDGFRSNFSLGNGIRRDPVPGSLEVYPIKDYGAMLVGAHRFCHRERSREECGTFRFLHVWRKEPAGWRVTRAVSYGH